MADHWKREQLEQKIANKIGCSIDELINHGLQVVPCENCAEDECDSKYCHGWQLTMIDEVG